MADLHLHSRYAISTSRDLGLERLAVGGKLRACDAYHSAVHILVNSYPSNVSMGISFSGVETRTLNATIAAPVHFQLPGCPGGILCCVHHPESQAFTNATISVGPTDGNPVAISSTGNGSIRFCFRLACTQ